jgi:hypothetical protein
VSDQSEDREDGYEDEDSVWVPLSIHLSRSEFLNMIVEELGEYDAEAQAVRGATVRLVDVEGDPTFVVELEAAFEVGMTAAVRGKSDSLTELGEIYLRTNPTKAYRPAK